MHRRLAVRDHSEPPPELDRLVLNKAREAIELPAPPALFRSPRWALPVGLAATVLLTFAVVLNMWRMHPAGVATSVSVRADKEAVRLDSTAGSAAANARSAPMAEPPTAPALEPIPPPASPAAAPSVAQSAVADTAASAGETEAASAARPPKAKRISPQDWLREIERLRADGKTAEADHALAEFRRAFPGHAPPGPALAQPPRQ